MSLVPSGIAQNFDRWSPPLLEISGDRKATVPKAKWRQNACRSKLKRVRAFLDRRSGSRPRRVSTRDFPLVSVSRGRRSGNDRLISPSRAVRDVHVGEASSDRSHSGTERDCNSRMHASARSGWEPRPTRTRARGMNLLAVEATPVAFRVRGAVFLRRTGVGTGFLRSHRKGGRNNLR